MTISMRPLVSIAIPTYNRADSYLKQTLESAVKQTYENLDIIVADNFSADNTEMVVKGFNDSRIRYFKHGRNIGHINNYSFCVEQARGEYLLLLHDDDLIDHDFVDTCLKSVNYSFTDIGIIRTGTRWIDSDSNLLMEIPNGACGLSIEAFFRAYFVGKTGLYLCSTIFNTKRLREIGGFKSRHNLFADCMAKIKLAAEYGRQDIYEIKASNRKHDSEMTWGVKISHWCEDSLMLIDLMCDLAPDNKNLVRAEGMRAMSIFNYRLASKIKSPFKRYITYLIVFKKFKFKIQYLPPPARQLIYNNPFFQGGKVRKEKTYAKMLETDEPKRTNGKFS